MNCGAVRVGDVMRTDVVSITPEATVADALCAAGPRGIRHLLVLDHGILAGIVSDRDLKRVLTCDDKAGGREGAMATSDSIDG